jgi:hypothetical protein
MKERNLLVCDTVQLSVYVPGISEQCISCVRVLCLLGVLFRSENSKMYSPKFWWVNTRLGGFRFQKESSSFIAIYQSL